MSNSAGKDFLHVFSDLVSVQLADADNRLHHQNKGVVNLIIIWHFWILFFCVCTVYSDCTPMINAFDFVLLTSEDGQNMSAALYNIQSPYIGLLLSDTQEWLKFWARTCKFLCVFPEMLFQYLHKALNYQSCQIPMCWKAKTVVTFFKLSGYCGNLLCMYIYGENRLLLGCGFYSLLTVWKPVFLQSQNGILLSLGQDSLH